MLPTATEPCEITQGERSVTSQAAPADPAILKDSGVSAGEPGAEPLLGVRQVAEVLRVSTATVYRLVNEGTLRALRVANVIRVAPAALRAFIRGQRERQS
jgi:excisionase family DNA binding protein